MTRTGERMLMGVSVALFISIYISYTAWGQAAVSEHGSVVVIEAGE